MADSNGRISNMGFSLVPAIFVPFHGVPKGNPVPRDRNEKLKRILEDLDKHQDAVRRNMMYLVKLQKEKLLSDAREAFEKQRAREESPGLDHARSSPDDPELDRDIKDLLNSLKEPAVKGTSGKEYEYEDGDFDVPRNGPVEDFADADGDTVMSGTDSISTWKRNIHQELNIAIRELVTRSAVEIEMYNKHAETTKDYYRRALERHNERERVVSGETAAEKTSTNAPPNAPTGPAKERRPAGILRHTSSQIRLNTEVLARMAKEDQAQALSPNQQVQSAIDVSRDPRRSAVDQLKDPRRHSVQFAQDSLKPSVDGRKDIWRR